MNNRKKCANVNNFPLVHLPENDPINESESEVTTSDENPKSIVVVEIILLTPQLTYKITDL